MRWTSTQAARLRAEQQIRSEQTRYAPNPGPGLEPAPTGPAPFTRAELDRIAHAGQAAYDGHQAAIDAANTVAHGIAMTHAIRPGVLDAQERTVQAAERIVRTFQTWRPSQRRRPCRAWRQRAFSTSTIGDQLQEDIDRGATSQLARGFRAAVLRLPQHRTVDEIDEIAGLLTMVGLAQFLTPRRDELVAESAPPAISSSRSPPGATPAMPVEPPTTPRREPCFPRTMTPSLTSASGRARRRRWRP